MKVGDVFEFGGLSYEIDLIGHISTVLSCSDGTWQLIDAPTLRHFLESNK